MVNTVQRDSSISTEPQDQYNGGPEVLVSFSVFQLNPYIAFPIKATYGQVQTVGIPSYGWCSITIPGFWTECKFGHTPGYAGDISRSTGTTSGRKKPFVVSRDEQEYVQDVYFLIATMVTND